MQIRASAASLEKYRIVTRVSLLSSDVILSSLVRLNLLPALISCLHSLHETFVDAVAFLLIPSSNLHNFNACIFEGSDPRPSHQRIRVSNTDDYLCAEALGTAVAMPVETVIGTLDIEQQTTLPLFGTCKAGAASTAMLTTFTQAGFCARYRRATGCDSGDWTISVFQLKR